MLSLPDKVTVVDVAPRDGLQSFPRWVETETKIAIVDRLSRAGFPVIEVTGFAHPRSYRTCATPKRSWPGSRAGPGPSIARWCRTPEGRSGRYGALRRRTRSSV